MNMRVAGVTVPGQLVSNELLEPRALDGRHHQRRSVGSVHGYGENDLISQVLPKSVYFGDDIRQRRPFPLCLGLLPPLTQDIAFFELLLEELIGLLGGI